MSVSPSTNVHRPEPRPASCCHRLGRWTATTLIALITLLSDPCIWAQSARAGRQPVGDRLPAASGFVVESSEHGVHDVPLDTQASVDAGASLNPALLEPIRDDTLGLQTGDQPAYFYGLWLCQQLDPKQMRAASRAWRERRTEELVLESGQRITSIPETTPFVDLFRHPNEYRGRLITLHGSLRRLIRHPAGTNDLGLTEVYEAWLFPPDSQQNPVVVMFGQPPNGIPIRSDLHVEIEVTGYFLKRYGYLAADTARTAPLVLAGPVRLFPQPPTSAGFAVTGWMYLLAAAASVLVGIALGRRKAVLRGNRFHSPGRDYDDYPPQEFLGESVSPGERPLEHHH